MAQWNLLHFEDEDMIRELYDAILSSKGHTIHQYEKPEHFLALPDYKAKLAASDAIITDGNMGGMHGINFISYLRTQESYKKPCILITSPQPRDPAIPEDNLVSLPDGTKTLFINQRLHKPVTGSTLLSILAQEIERQNH